MKRPALELPPRPPAYQGWVAQLGRTGWICHGTVVRRSLKRRGQGRWLTRGPYYMWTCKAAGKTVCHALSRQQYAVLKKLIAAQRRTQRILARMQAFTLATVLKKVPGVRKRN
jgi:hypothetical protein